MKAFILIFLSLLFISATATKNGFELKDPLIPIDDILSGGPPRDGIPSIDEPEFISSRKAKKVFGPEERALIIEVGGTKKAYPTSILNWHEVVNDKISDFNIVVTYCPLCGSGIIFLSEYGGKNLEFGVSGLLYQSDVLLYDRLTESLWSQLELKAISGRYKGTPMTPLPSKHLNLHTYLDENPDALVLSTKTGFVRDYSSSPYKGYEKENRTYFPVKVTSDKYHKKEWSLLINEKLIIPLSSLDGKKGTKTFKVGQESFKVRWDQDKKELSCEAQSQKCISAYFFALKTFYPDAKVN
ncbi:MAG: hypothetical protein CME64_01010 [Halobacteriovoraceae bacterium]|nr:hypothetical protein [Halobacteriovoraceae bacterium]|tara:strand:+ start:221151 stop:222044 length:894 start_codon:yes stop_codon:yes gene_type:complete